MKDKDGNTKHYEISHSQVLQQRTNKLLTILIILIIGLILGFGFTLIKIDIMNIPTRLIYGW